MNFGLVVLIAVCVWSLLSIVTSLTGDVLDETRDADPVHTMSRSQS